GGLVHNKTGDTGRRIVTVDCVAVAGLLDRGVQRQHVETHQAVHFYAHRNAVGGDGRRRKRKWPERDEQRGAEPASGHRHWSHQPITSADMRLPGGLRQSSLLLAYSATTTVETLP